MPGWFGKKDDEIPKALQGMTPEQAAAELERLKAIEAQVAAGGDVKTVLENFTKTMDEVKNRLDAIETNSRPPEPKPKNEEVADALTDPDGFIRQRVGPLAELQVKTSAVVARGEARRQLESSDRGKKPQGRDAFYFDKYAAEIDNLAKGVPATQLIDPQAWIHLYYNVKGRHADEIAANAAEKKEEFSIESGGNGRPEPEPKKDGVESLTAVEIKVARGMGITPEQYAERKKHLTMVA